MSGDFNQKNISYEALVGFEEDNTFGLLNEEAKNTYAKIESEISEQYSNNEEYKKKFLNKLNTLKYFTNINGLSFLNYQYQFNEYNSIINFYTYRKKYILNINSCLICLNSFMYQSKKIEYHNEKLKTIIPPKDNSPTVIAESSLEACSDFESLLYQARSTLDRITFFICKQVYKDSMENFNKRIVNILKNFKKDNRSVLAIEVLNISIPKFQGLLIDKAEGGTSLRSLLAHSKSHSEAINGEFTVHRSQNYILRFDQELDGYPLLNSSHLLVQYMVFTALNLIAIYLNTDIRIEEDKCIARWVPCALKSSEFKVDKDYPNALPFTIPLFVPSGFIPDTYYFKNEILEYVETLKES